MHSRTCRHAHMYMPPPQVMGEVLLSAAHVAYLGPVSGTLRSAVEEEWQELLRAQVRGGRAGAA